ncbi:MAG: phosphatidate cytidylyltransferase [Sphingobacteriales bacterium]|jgi:FtsH-binding integral membrane protein|nr:phosphatidate cytidylyltransferase [Sphingobacteriales bacterium]
MKLRLLSLVLLILMLSFASCGVVEPIFKAGMWWAFFLVILGVALVLFIASKMRK